MVGNQQGRVGGSFQGVDSEGSYKGFVYNVR